MNNYLQAFINEINKASKNAIAAVKRSFEKKEEDYILTREIESVKFVDEKVCEVSWKDGTKTKVVNNGNSFEEEAITIAVAKHCLGNFGLAGEIRHLLKYGTIKRIISKKAVTEETQAVVMEQEDEAPVGVNVRELESLFERLDDVLEEELAKADLDEYTHYNDGADYTFEVRDEDDHLNRSIKEYRLGSKVREIFADSRTIEEVEERVTEYFKSEVLPKIIADVSKYDEKTYGDKEVEEDTHKDEVDDYEDEPVVSTPVESTSALADNVKVAKRNSRGNWEVRTKEIRMERTSREKMEKDMASKGYTIIFRD